jgi:hypothetical protein
MASPFSYRHGTARHGTARHGTARHGTVRYGVQPEARLEHLAQTRRWIPTSRKRDSWFPMQTHPRRTQCGVGANESFVANAECARTQIPDAPLPQLRGGPAYELAV